MQAQFTQQVEATREAAETARLEMHAEFAQQLESLTTRRDGNQQANDRYQVLYRLRWKNGSPNSPTISTRR